MRRRPGAGNWPDMLNQYYSDGGHIIGDQKMTFLKRFFLLVFLIVMSPALASAGTIVANPFITFKKSWTPNSESSCFGWYESESQVTTTGNGVSVWGDLCDSNNDLSQSTDSASRRPELDTATTPDSINFNNLNESLQTAAYGSNKTQPITVVVCFHLTPDNSNEKHLFSSDTTTERLGVFFDNPAESTRMDAGNEKTGANDDNAKKVAMFEFDDGGNTCKSWNNGTVGINTTTCGSETWDNLVVGNFADNSSVSFEGDIFYFAAFEAAFSTSLKNMAGNHAADYCGTTWTDIP